MSDKEGRPDGDWRCNGCGNINWARRNHCNRCGGERTLVADCLPNRAAPRKESKAPAIDEWGGVKNEQKAPRLPPGIDDKVGDWMCKSCGNWNWARRGSCNKCGASRR